MSKNTSMLVERLNTERDKTLEFFSTLPDPIWTEKLYADGEHWTVRQVFVHLVQTENSILHLMKKVKDGAGGVTEDFDLNGYNERKVRQAESAPLAELLGLFKTHRAATIDWVKDLSDEDLAKQGRHPFLGIGPIEEMVKLLYRHTQLHQRDIRRLMDTAD